MNLNARQFAILNRIRQGAADVWALRNQIAISTSQYGVPYPSIRRNIQELRSFGYPITNSRGYYRIKAGF